MLFYHKRRSCACKPTPCLLVWTVTMKRNLHKCKAFAAVSLLLLLVANPAAAFRCGNKLVKEGMHEVEVVAICGDPSSKQFLGYGIRSVDIRSRDVAPPGWTITRPYGYWGFPQEVRITEYIYNLGPRKLMRRLVFEGGFLARIETLGRGHVE